MRRLIDFLLNMDAKAWRTLAVSFVLFGGVGLVFFFGASILGLNGEAAVEQWLGAASTQPWGLPVAIACFAALAFLGVPQIILIAAAVVAFGPWQGFAYSWVGTMVSSIIGFWLGRQFGARILRDIAGAGVKRFMDMIGENGFLASLIVRLVPSAPFIVVNMAAGVTPMRTRDFFAGTGVGIIPKIALTAFAGNSVLKAVQGGGMQHVLVLALVAVIWIGAGWVARNWLKRREARAAAASDAGVDGGV
ncbi:MAG: TVP38/TMEM64 family protein [Caulobacterales bacterium 68-7]|nr:MAG: TVP38/TMEM64 family protein [Caulobacterales bacterium 68-7]